jgi:hypothetical protein
MCFLVYTGFAVYLILKANCKLDLKAWLNIGVNVTCFGIKAAEWIYMMTQFDKEEEKKMPPAEYEE